MTGPKLPAYGRAIAAGVARRLVTGDAAARLVGVCFDCDEDAANCRCVRRTTLRQNDDGTVTWIRTEEPQ